ncbi:FG-GAP repeat protein [uncultured Friedmanniella sp.]|uniref:FG-GAP repeat protein n=1 Tax=uncultured Friedmanniella sp. TaxID=335381 RepID=UPI0035CB1031
MNRSYRRAAVATLTCVGLAAAATGTLASTAIAAPKQAPVTAAARAVPADFNDDGYADIAVGVPGEDIGAATDAGSVQILYGSATGIVPSSSRTFRQGAGGVLDSPETGDHFGAAVAIGNFNGDAYADVAVGVPGEDFAGVTDAGAVQIFYGSASGITAAGNRFLSQATAGSASSPRAGDRFGTTLAAGDIAGSTQADLAVGVPYEDVGSAKDAGAVQILRGSPSGITISGDQLLTQNTAGAGDKSERGDRFGAALAIGNLGAGTKRDLAVGVPLEDVGKVVDAGAIQFFPGTTGAVTTRGDKVITQNSSGVGDKSEKGDRFGSALAVADFAGSSYKDLAVGIPYENVGKAADAGAIALLRGTKSGLTTLHDQFISQDSKSAVDKAEKSDRFGSALAGANLTRTSKADLAVGVPLENFNGKSDAGAVQIIPGATGGLDLGHDQLIQQDLKGSDAAVETGDHFGAALGAANTIGTSFADLTVGVPYEKVGTATAGGSVQVFQGQSNYVTAGGDQVFTQSSAPGVSASENGDHFGAAVSAG